jgi:hypothetical protein
LGLVPGEPARYGGVGENEPWRERMAGTGSACEITRADVQIPLKVVQQSSDYDVTGMG